MSSASSLDDEFELFRARAYSGGNLMFTFNLRNENHSRFCAADGESSDNDDEERACNYCNNSGENLGLRVPRPQRSRSLSPGYPVALGSSVPAKCKTQGRESPQQGLNRYCYDCEGTKKTSGSTGQQQVCKIKSFDISFPQSYTDQQELEQPKDTEVRKDVLQRRNSHSDHTPHSRRSRPTYEHSKSHTAAKTEENPWDIGEMRPRVCSMPSDSLIDRTHHQQHTRHTISNCVHRIREFQLTSKGNVINKGIHLSRSNTSVESGGSTTASATSLTEGPYYVYLMGVVGVGVRAIINMFMSEDMDSFGEFCPVVFHHKPNTE